MADISSYLYPSSVLMDSPVNSDGLKKWMVSGVTLSPWVIEVGCIALENDVKSVVPPKAIPELIPPCWVLA